MFKNTERLIAFGIIYQCYSSQKPSFNPFLSEMISVGTLHCVSNTFTNANFFTFSVLLRISILVDCLLTS